ncbi:MAG TPA: helix-turn-helix transcriptional regulator [Methylotenera sp.]|nr:helix-turn-helix transcriptional regulator [Methylotenera sp.]
MVHKLNLELRKQLGANIANRRKSLGWTQQFLGIQLNVDAETISRVERGINTPSLGTLAEYAKILSIPISELFCGFSVKPLRRDEVVAKLIGTLEEEDKKFVLDWLQNLSHYIVTTKKNLRKPIVVR